MTSRLFICLFAACLAPATLPPATALAHCGSDSCPIDLHTRWEHQRFSLDLTQQYLDQEQPRAGTQDVPVGSIPSDEDEVRTINRITSLRATWRPTESWIVTGSLPYVNRTHEHIMNEPGSPPMYMTWNYEGLGDTEVALSRDVWSGQEGDFELRLNAGLKMPTGRTTVPEVMGEQPEVSARPGSGSWDGSLGAASRWLISMPVPSGNRGAMPLRLGVVGRWNGSGTEDYRVGNEVQAHLSGEYPLTSALGLLVQGNWRSKQKDEVGSSGEEDENTGGSWVYATPGLSLQVGGQARIYGLVQIPVYQRVNGIQLVSDYNVYVGASRGMF